MIKFTSKVSVEQALATSPCVGNCCLDADDICIGCQRHIDEITGWHQADTEQRREILSRCENRLLLRSQ